MVKFPLEQAPFPALALCSTDKELLLDITDRVTADALYQYATHVYKNNGVVDAREWIPMNVFENVTVYQNRRAVIERRLSRANTTRERSDNHTDMVQLLWSGTVLGDLDDLMYGVVNPTAEEAKVKAAYVQSNMLDCLVLDTLIAPTVDDPFRGVQIKWAANGGPPATRSFVRCRDFVYVETTGMATLSTGERVGYHVLHSVGIPQVSELHQYKLIRGEMTLCHFFRQKNETEVDTFVTAFIDVKGDMPLRMATKMSAKGVVSVWDLTEYSLMKKLNWKLSQRHPIAPCQRSDFCPVCKRDLRGAMTRRRTCKICVAEVCSRCYVTKKMFYVPAHSRAVAERPWCICMKCLQTASYMNGLDLALAELSKKSEQHTSNSYWATLSPTSSSSSLCH